jgi:hypothetical protein
VPSPPAAVQDRSAARATGEATTRPTRQTTVQATGRHNSFCEQRKKSEAARVAYLERAKQVPEYNYDDTVAFEEDVREVDPEDDDYEIVKVLENSLYIYF